MYSRRPYFGTSFILHLGQWPGFVSVTSGCIGHVYTSAASAWETGIGWVAGPKRTASAESSRADERSLGMTGRLSQR